VIAPARDTGWRAAGVGLLLLAAGNLVLGTWNLTLDRVERPIYVMPVAVGDGRGGWSPAMGLSGRF